MNIISRQSRKDDSLPTVNRGTEQTDVTVPGWVFLVLNGVIAVTALIIGLVARLMAVPGVNEWLTNIGLGSVPKRAVVGTTGWGDASIIPDPKV